MAETDPMTVDERRKYLHTIRLRYWRAEGRKERSRLLDEAQAVTGLHRKSLIRLLNGELGRKRRKRERGKRYGPEVDAAIAVIARRLDYPCAERLQPNLVWMARHLQAHGELLLSETTLELLGKISISSVRRRLPASQRAAQRLAHRVGRPAPTSSVRSFIPMRRIAWEERQPGHLEVDLVHHCGLSSQGKYVHTLQLVDVASGWSECVAVLGRSWLVMQDGFERIRQRLPFAIRELHPDNGSEFLNAHLLRYWKDKVKADVPFTRTTIALWKKTTSRWCAPMSAMVGWTRWNRPICSTNSMTNSGYTITSSSLSCACKKNVSAPNRRLPKSNACTPLPSRLSNGSSRPVHSPRRNRRPAWPCGSKPIPCACVKRSRRWLTASPTCPVLQRVRWRMSA